MTEKKMTQAQAIGFVLENYELPDEVEEKLAHMLEQLGKKSSGTSKKSREKTELDEKLKALVLNYFRSPFYNYSDVGGITVTEIQNEVEGLSLTQGISSSKVTHIFGLLRDEGKLERNVVKGKARYRLIEA